jgi:hypothetical protein
MNSIRKFGGLALTLCALAAAAPAGSDDTPESYQLRVPITTAPGSTIQRLAIPAAVLAASRSADFADLRVFDATKRAMPIARIAPAAGPGRLYDLPALPILGSADALNVTGVSLRLDGNGASRVAQVVGTLQGGPATATILGGLLDARAVKGNPTSLTLDADTPQAQPVTFTVEASADLKNWRTLGDKVVYRGGAGEPTKIDLADATLADDYLRITWRAASRLLAPVTVRKAVLATGAPSAATVSIAAALPPIADPHAIDIALPFASPIETLQIVPTGTDMIVPVRLFGRKDREQPWALLGQGTATRPHGPADSSRAITLDGQPHRLLRIEADQRSPGFTSPPTLRLDFAPRAIVFLAAGRPPFTLASGRVNASDKYLPLDSVVTQPGTTIPVATATAPETVLQLEPAMDAGISGQKTLLWIVLLAATALLAAMAWVLWKRHPTAK